MKDKNTFACIIPVLPSDYLAINAHIYKVLDMLSVSKLIFIGPAELRESVFGDAKQKGIQDRVEFLDENEILPFEKVKQAYKKRIEEIEGLFGTVSKSARPGWYYQQFLKMEYSRICEDEYYLCWDADTIPLRSIDMFHSSGKPYLDVKAEYRPAYFDTLKNLLGIGKVIEQSFISEHMLFKKDLMLELLDTIMAADLSGNTFYEKIFSAVRQPFNGFSEFETYGTWIACKYPDKYRIRSWKSLRNTSFMVNRNDLTDDDIRWLATGFYAASFERYQETEPLLNTLFRNPEYRRNLTADNFYNALLKEGLFGEYQNGGIIYEDGISPI